ncbi:hypothetical protein OSC27_10935 [Microbacterium sp. STN6]|uniref:hypothetical protein n=1 Tax=Microbacterium sp. STN6 TaxID=2995588 RepID=UPI002260B2C0|nr:hypothetical protein [Microbacterium sp. STN6]MCX7522788.1 hypothetical protein [Microbacterium sp. STN6]
MTRRLRLLGLLGVVVMLLGVGCLAVDAQQRIRDSAVTISVKHGATVSADRLHEIRQGVQQRRVISAVTLGSPTRPQHWIDFTEGPDGSFSYSSSQSDGPMLILPGPSARLISPAALPFTLGLGVVIVTLFITAARWRPRERAHGVIG